MVDELPIHIYSCRSPPGLFLYLKGNGGWVADPGLFQFTDKVSDSLIPTDTRSRGLSRLFICKLRRYINLAEFGDYILVLECDLDCEWS